MTSVLSQVCSKYKLCIVNRYTVKNESTNKCPDHIPRESGRKN